MSSPLCLRLCVCAAACFVPACLWAQPVELQNAVPVQTDEVLVRPGQDWSARVQAPGGADEHLVLWLEARLHLEGGKGGGCNWLLRILIDDQVLGESWARPRLLNKPPFFDFADGKYHFSWFRRTYDAWMTMFADTYDVDTAGTGQDTGFLFDLSDYVQPGDAFRLRIEYAQPNIPAVLKKDAPLAVRNIVLGTLSAQAVQQLREQALSGDGGSRQVPIKVDVDPDEQAGEQPYEIAWAGRAEDPPAQVAFEDLKGWQATVFGDGEVSVAASRARRIWREQVAKVTVGECKSLLLELRPPQPIPIPAEANAVNCWVYSDYQHHTQSTPPELTVTVSDSRGACADLDCGRLRGKYWELRQGIAPAERLGRLRPPLHFHSLTLSAGRIAKPVTLYLESLAFFKRERKPYAQMAEIGEPRFPTTDDNMLPPAPEACTVTVQQSQDGQGAVFISTSPEGVLKYVVQPREGGLSDVTAQFGEGPVFQPMAGAALRIETALGALAADGERVNVVTSRVEGDRLATKWRFSAEGVSAEYEVRYQLRGRTLMVDVSCPGGLGEGLSLGKVRGLPDARGLEVPYLVFANFPSPRIAMGGGVFTSVLVDWYHSSASIIDTSAARDQPDEDGLAVNGGTVYSRLTDGTRNDLADRVLITVSPDIHDTFPSIATPRSDKIEELAPAMFIMSSMFTPKYYATLKRYGLDEIIAIHFAGIWWTRAGEGFAMRWRPRPDLTEEQVAQYRADIKGLGYKWGMLVNYTCFMPVTEYWDENLISLTREGRLADGWYGTYQTKPNAMRELARIVGENIRARYPTDCVYLDVHTNWGAAALDYEAGVEGAGTVRAVILGNAACIREVHRQQDSLCSEGIRRWLYAGLADMDYAQWVGRQKSEHKPLLPDFDLLRIHPKQIGTAMGYGPRCFFSDEALAEYFKDPCVGTSHQPLYHYVAATLAHGHSAMIGYGYFPALARTIHYYALLSGPQEDYLPDTVADIDWYSDDAGEFATTSEALQTGVREAGKLRVSYAGGQVVHVNYHPEDTWRLTVDEREFLLPPYGWLITKPGEILAYSALVEGRRVDYVECPRYLYLNSGEGPVTEGAVTVDGAVFIKRGRPLVVIPCGDLGRWQAEPCEAYPMFRDRGLEGAPGDRGVRLLRIDAARLLGVGEAERLNLAHRDEQGGVVKTETVAAGAIEISPSAEIADYLAG